MKEIIITSIDAFKKVTSCFDTKFIQSVKLDKEKFYFYLKNKNFNDDFRLFYLKGSSKFEFEAISSSKYYTFYFPVNKENNILNNIKTANDMFIIIPLDFHFHFLLKDTFSTAYAIQIEKSIIEEKLGKLDYQVISVKDKDKDELTDFKNLVVLMFKLNKSDLITIDKSIINIIKNLKIFLTNSTCYEDTKVQLFREIIHYMDDNYKVDLTISEIAKYFDISTRTMSNLFNEMIGYSPKKYLIANKMNKLKIEIQNDTQNLTISQLMINNNLQYQSQVSKDFKRFFNKTPSEYKK